MKYLILISLLALSACASTNSQNQYSYQEVGKASETQTGTILKVREVAITGENRGNGSLAGGALGLAAASHSNSAVVAVGATIVGAIVGNIAEQQLANSKGYEYTIRLNNKKVVTVVQNQATGDEVFHRGEKVMIQTGQGYQRVLAE